MTINLKFISASLICLIMIGSCQKIPQKTYEVPKFASNQSEYSDDEMINATYSTYKIPDNFYHEKLGDTSLYYVNTISVGNVENNKWIELSTNSADTAREWSVKSSSINSVFAPVVENEKYFEYLRISNPADNQIIKFRTHKRSYFIRSSDDFLNNPDTIGTFNKLNFSGADAKEFIDYLWYTHDYDNASMKILSSYFEDSPLEAVVYHYGLFIGYGDRGVYDQIKLLKSDYSLDKETGIIVVKVTEIRTIKGNLK
jgi:hypothetical protein